MARPRLNQFADDLSITRGSAQKLMKEARGRKDGGSTILENTMDKTKVVKAKRGKSVCAASSVKPEKENKFVRGMGRIYMSEPRAVQVK